MSTVSRETQLDQYLELIARWGARVNLTSAGDRSRLRRHIDDSLAIVPYLPRGLTRLVDLGSGQGFPAIPVAIETGVLIDLIEADRRKAAFLTTVLATLHLPGSVSASRIEVTELPPAGCVTARALTRLNRLAALARPFLAPGGVCLFLKGPEAAVELAEATQQGVNGEILPLEGSTSCLVRLRDIR